MLAAAQAAGERAWPLPMFPHYREMIKSDVADIKNTGGSRYAGAISAAKFLEEFVGRRAVGAPGHRRPGLGGEGERDARRGRHGLLRPHAGGAGAGVCWIAAL